MHRRMGAARPDPLPAAGGHPRQGGRPGGPDGRGQGHRFQVEPTRGGCHPQVGSPPTGECPAKRARREVPASRVDERSHDDPHHVVQEVVPFDRYLQQLCVASCSTHIGAHDLSHRVRTRVRRAAVGSKVVTTRHVLELFHHGREIQRVSDPPRSTLEQRIANRTEMDVVPIPFADHVVPGIEPRRYPGSADDSNLWG